MHPLPFPLEQEMKAALDAVYGQERVEEMFARIESISGEILQARPALLREEDLLRSSDWYKDEIVYMLYPDQFGVEKDCPGTFRELTGMLDYLFDLGVTTLYILPFMDSPMGDAGFDVRDPSEVRADLGGLAAFQAFAEEARKRGFKIKADLILNHFSDQHAWFQAALEGNREMMSRFLYRRDLPTHRKYTDPQRGVVVEYEEDGRVSSRRLIFPDISRDHYRPVRIGKEEYFFYHTFYPFQLDVDWENPEVLYYMLRLIGTWANRGIDIFRMDAIPYFIKEPGTDGENLPRTHRVVKLLSAFLQGVAPRSVIQAEACQWPTDILPYFGRERCVERENSPFVRTDEVQLAYNFPYMPALWASLLTGEKQHFWKAFYGTPTIPSSAAWSIFLRVHDELTLEMVDQDTRRLLYEHLLPLGGEFRKGLGVSGRMFDFLEQDPRRIEQAFALLLSLPGVPTFYYGDEIGAGNNWDWAKKAEAARKENLGVEVLSFFDSRDINRGPIPREAFLAAREKQIYQRVRHLIAIRKKHEGLRRGEIIEVASEMDNFLAYRRKWAEGELLIVHNLAARTAEFSLPSGKNPPSWIDLVSGEKIPFEKAILSLAPFRSVWLDRC